MNARARHWLLTLTEGALVGEAMIGVALLLAGTGYMTNKAPTDGEFARVAP